MSILGDHNFLKCILEAGHCAGSIAEELGMRPYRVLLVRTQWTGTRRSHGQEEVISEVELTPRPRIEGWEGISLDLSDQGRVEIGRLTAYVSASYSEEDLLPEVGPTEDFFWEIVDADTNKRRRFFPDSAPGLEPGKTERKVILRRIMDDRDSIGQVPEMKMISPVKA